MVRYTSFNALIFGDASQAGSALDRYRIDEAPQAFEDLAQGRNARRVIVFD